MRRTIIYALMLLAAILALVSIWSRNSSRNASAPVEHRATVPSSTLSNGPSREAPPRTDAPGRPAATPGVRP
jgi:hypothetical protein